MAALEGPLVLVGCGKMGGAMLQGWLDRGLDPADVHVVEPSAAALADFKSAGVRHYPHGSALPA